MSLPALSVVAIVSVKDSSPSVKLSAFACTSHVAVFPLIVAVPVRPPTKSFAVIPLPVAIDQSIVVPSSTLTTLRVNVTVELLVSLIAVGFAVNVT